MEQSAQTCCTLHICNIQDRYLTHATVSTVSVNWQI